MSTISFGSPTWVRYWTWRSKSLKSHGVGSAVLEFSFRSVLSRRIMMLRSEDICSATPGVDARRAAGHAEHAIGRIAKAGILRGIEILEACPAAILDVAHPHLEIARQRIVRTVQLEPGAAISPNDRIVD